MEHPWRFHLKRYLFTVSSLYFSPGLFPFTSLLLRCHFFLSFLWVVFHSFCSNVNPLIKKTMKMSFRPNKTKRKWKTLFRSVCLWPLCIHPHPVRLFLPAAVLFFYFSSSPVRSRPVSSVCGQWFEWGLQETSLLRVALFFSPKHSPHHTPHQLIINERRNPTHWLLKFSFALWAVLCVCVRVLSKITIKCLMYADWAGVFFTTESEGGTRCWEMKDWRFLFTVNFH